jgi:hypothetical protein
LFVFLTPFAVVAGFLREMLASGGIGAEEMSRSGFEVLPIQRVSSLRGTRFQENAHCRAQASALLANSPDKELCHARISGQSSCGKQKGRAAQELDRHDKNKATAAPPTDTNTFSIGVRGC